MSDNQSDHGPDDGLDLPTAEEAIEEQEGGGRSVATEAECNGCDVTAPLSELPDGDHEFEVVETIESTSTHITAAHVCGQCGCISATIITREENIPKLRDTLMDDAPNDEYPVADREDEHPCQTKALALDDGDEVVFNERSRPLIVDGRHKRQTTSSTWRRRGVSKYLDVIELHGNGTEYHLLCHAGGKSGPVLYMSADWDDDKEDDLGQSPKYSRMGERVENMEVVSDE